MCQLSEPLTFQTGLGVLNRATLRSSLPGELERILLTTDLRVWEITHITYGIEVLWITG